MHCLVMVWWMVFGKVICIVITASFLMDLELSLMDVVSDPIKAHAKGF